ncbi:uncharacterized protein LOC122384297 [Amphibalanus amphitrite]|uniref:uncharacterized protein LOC122384297 n=1 Tax=Amphibalanus amphitrite TaxID=1232801 RepID=UPI001C90B9FA|nr:uncharacterized protein LOC122384297 [Amphibalanus amphitrite]
MSRSCCQHMCPAAPAAPEGTNVTDYGQFASGQRNATYSCENGTEAVVFCQNGSWTAGATPCQPGYPVAPPAAPPGVFVTDSGPVTDENGTVTYTLTYDCGIGVTELVWKDGEWTPENAVPCADLSNACPSLNASADGVPYTDTGPYAEGVRNATYSCGGAGLADTFLCLNGTWSPEGLAPCDGKSFPSGPDGRGDR